VNVYSGPVSGQLIMAVYTDNGSGAPNHLIYQTPPQNVVPGWNSAPFPDIYLLSGKYWLTFLFASNTNGTWNPSVGTEYSAFYGWGILPTTFPTGGTTGFSQDAIYLSTCP
jgi:hypothetical protein